MRMAMVGRSRSTAHWLAAAGLASLLASTLLAGCATQASQQQASTIDMVTPSDEPENRKRARIRLELATGYFQEGKTEVALDELKQVIAADPTLGDAYNLRGLVYMRLGDNREAEESFRRAIAINPRDANAHHNYGWLQCQLGRYPESYRSFDQAMANPLYPDKAKSLMTLGLCQARGGLRPEAERSLTRAYELDAGNPIVGYNLARLLYQRGDYERAQFYIRRLNNSELANAETLWLGIKVENRMNDAEAMAQLSDQLRKRYPQSRERQSLDRKAFDE
ncbi:type IV pilus biogenesis/stability protein PilW [Ramlibacter monticola]|uniref:Type IV pilus biogenesis/stability protein PilW n=1 Tax=Ramlibacter monticola TaxID=1926872 RepID=A0A937CS50_9BURK|nr:type IV pilus biogenesis/stability protein PilW [Ramlibacter monticola]MBL0389717.1 type IV pilus biogenesis/stability protein PilW [Ramlibacter monticola]